MADTTHNDKSPGGLDTPMIAMVGVISIVLFIVLVVATEAWFYNQQRQFDELDYKRGNPELQAKVDDQEKKLDSLQKIAGMDGRVTIPLESAIDLYVKQQGAPASK